MREFLDPLDIIEGARRLKRRRDTGGCAGRLRTNRAVLGTSDLEIPPFTLLACHRIDDGPILFNDRTGHTRASGPKLRRMVSRQQDFAVWKIAEWQIVARWQGWILMR